MERDLLKAVYLASWIALAIIRVPYRLMAGRVAVVVDHKDAREILVLVQLAVGMIVLPLLYVFTPFLDFADYHLPAWTAWVGAVASAGGLWLFWRSHAALRANWSDSVQFRRGHELITSGIYASIRHPMHAGGWWWAAAPMLLLQNWIAGWSSLLTFGVLYFTRVPREERMMLDHFGERDQAYMRRTGRVIPRRRAHRGFR